MTFLNTLAELNIPLSLVNNRQAREQYRRLKSHGDWGGEEEHSPGLFQSILNLFC